MNACEAEGGMENKLYQKLLAEVRDEKLLWHGPPVQGLRFRLVDALLIPIMILFILAFIGVIFSTPPEELSPFAMTGAVIVAIGYLYLLVGHFFHDAWRRKNIYYGLSPDHVIIILSGGKKVRLLSLKAVSEVNLLENKSERGSIIFGPAPSFVQYLIDPSVAMTLWYGGFISPAFESIPDARAVYDLVVQAQQSNNKKE